MLESAKQYKTKLTNNMWTNKQQGCWRFQPSGDVTLHYWTSSSQNFEGTSTFSNIRNYLAHDTSPHLRRMEASNAFQHNVNKLQYLILSVTNTPIRWIWRINIFSSIHLCCSPIIIRSQFTTVFNPTFLSQKKGNSFLYILLIQQYQRKQAIITHLTWRMRQEMSP